MNNNDQSYVAEVTRENVCLASRKSCVTSHHEVFPSGNNTKGELELLPQV